MTPTPDTEPPPRDPEPGGLERVRMLVDGRRRSPGMWRTIGMRLVEVEVGRAVVQVVPGQRHANGNAIAHGGLVATMADSATGAATSSTLDSGQRISTVDLQVDYLRPVSLQHGVVTAVGEVTHRGRRIAHADCTVSVGDRVVATGRAVFAVFDRTAT